MIDWQVECRSDENSEEGKKKIEMAKYRSE